MKLFTIVYLLSFNAFSEEVNRLVDLVKSLNSKKMESPKNGCKPEKVKVIKGRNFKRSQLLKIVK